VKPRIAISDRKELRNIVQMMWKQWSGRNQWWLLGSVEPRKLLAFPPQTATTVQHDEAPIRTGGLTPVSLVRSDTRPKGKGGPRSESPRTPQIVGLL
jgi:hypothetical protein